jgi:hypothetical protein
MRRAAVASGLARGVVGAVGLSPLDVVFKPVGAE